jgi:hypothetical protein
LDRLIELDNRLHNDHHPPQHRYERTCDKADCGERVVLDVECSVEPIESDTIKGMNALAKFVPLSDAYYYLNQAKGLPVTVKTIEHINRCTRSCIILTFAALEGAVAYEMRKLKESGYTGRIPNKVGDGLVFLMSRNQQPFDLKIFLQYRALRRRIVHPPDSAVYVAPPHKKAEEFFEYSIGLMRAFYSNHLRYDL